MKRKRWREGWRGGHSAYLLQQVSLLDSLQYTLLRRVLDLPSHQKLVQDEVSLLKVKDDVQLTHLHKNKTEEGGEQRGGERREIRGGRRAERRRGEGDQRREESREEERGGRSEEGGEQRGGERREIRGGRRAERRREEGDQASGNRSSYVAQKLHILGLRASTTCMSSRTIFFLSRSAVAVYHFCSRSFPCRLNSSMKRICNSQGLKGWRELGYSKRLTEPQAVAQTLARSLHLRRCRYPEAPWDKI
ncbi:hypothetical protein JZ751_024378 [Albula glossodonta]|uniref:Uncharacterized protein n=1 Tax=Albula glossodonta TaxID=121402 RepID=A0A8T2NMY5_9TELE|nr:hypothetical protein JZ751_024378 [Albula glossodonta]